MFVFGNYVGPGISAVEDWSFGDFGLFVAELEASSQVLTNSFAWMVVSGAQNVSSSWTISAEQDSGISWRLLHRKTAKITARIITINIVSESAWKILDRIATNLSWASRVEEGYPFEWKIRISSPDSLSWGIKNTIKPITTWRIQKASARQTAWLLKNAAVMDMASMILTQDENLFAWRDQSCKRMESSWDIRSGLVISSAWKMFSVASTNIASKIIVGSENDLDWLIDTWEQCYNKVSWMVFNEIDQAIQARIQRKEVFSTSWGIKRGSTSRMTWKIASISIPLKVFSAQSVQFSLISKSSIHHAKASPLQYVLSFDAGNILAIVGRFMTIPQEHLIEISTQDFAYHVQTDKFEQTSIDIFEFSVKG